MKKGLILLIMGLGLLAKADEGWQYYDTGYHVGPTVVEKSYFYYKPTIDLFTSYFDDRAYAKMASDKPVSFSTLVDSVQKFIVKERDGRFTGCPEGDCDEAFVSINGMGYIEMSQEIVKATFCFGTDPFVTASKIKQESRFDMTKVSNEYAFGLTQFTEIGLEEVLDQLGYRGPAEYYQESIIPFVKSIRCYLAGRENIFTDFPKIEVIKNAKKQKVYSAQTLRNITAWLKAKKTSTVEERKIFVVRQILFGQLLLKTYLGFAAQTYKKATMARIYDLALQMYNGDNIKVQYAKQILRSSGKYASL